MTEHIVYHRGEHIGYHRGEGPEQWEVRARVMAGSNIKELFFHGVVYWDDRTIRWIPLCHDDEGPP